MTIDKRLAIGAGVFLLILGGELFRVPVTRANEPAMDYWFSETITLEHADLPDGLFITASDPATSVRAYLDLRNQNDTPLYVMSLNYKDVLVMATPDPGWKRRLNLAHEAASYLVMPNKPASLRIEALADLDMTLVDRNVLSLDPPPADIVVPTAQYSELLLVYDGQVIEVPFSITYTLNRRFDIGEDGMGNSTSSLQATEHASATQQAKVMAEATARNAIVAGLAGIVVLMAVGWLVWAGVRRRNKNQ